jgi:hypothetical protein
VRHCGVINGRTAWRGSRQAASGKRKQAGLPGGAVILIIRRPSSRDLNLEPSRPDVPPNPIHPSSTHPQQASPLPTSHIQPGGLPWTFSAPQSHFTASATSLDPSRRHQTLQAHQAHTALHPSRPPHPPRQPDTRPDPRNLRHRLPPPASRPAAPRRASPSIRQSTPPHPQHPEQTVTMSSNRNYDFLVRTSSHGSTNLHLPPC